MKIDRLSKISICLLGILAAGILANFLLGRLLPVLLPFLIAWAVAFAVRGPARRLSERTRIPEGALRVLMALFFTLFVFAVTGLLLWQLMAALWRFLSDFGEGNALYELLMRLVNPELPLFGGAIPPELSERISAAVGDFISGALSSLASSLTGWVGKLPEALFFLLVTVIALIYFSLDLERINRALRSLLPERTGNALSGIRKRFFEVGGKYLKSYALILLITFVILLVGFLLLGVKNPFLVAAIVSVLDLLPVIGVGTVIVPWSVLAFISGNRVLGVGLIVLFAVNTVTRQFSEPRILGKSLDMHPILTLVFLYAGYALFGIVGLFTVPVIAVLVSVLFKKDSAAEVGEGAIRE